MKNTHRDRMLAAFAVILVAVGCILPSLIQVEAPSYLERRDGFTTNLFEPGPSPQSWENETPPPDVEEVFYESGDLKLKAWVYVPDGEQAEQHPALIYFHGGFAFGAIDMIDSQPFMDAGYVVMFPMLRGENGNPGNFELFFGEIDDAQAAANWLAEQPYVDRERLYAFGHSVGGGVSALLSLMEDSPIRHSGSSGGLYHGGIFEAWNSEGLVPFDWKNEEEVEFRLLLGNLRHMQHAHYGFIGKEDYFFTYTELLVKEEMGNSESLLSIIPVEGDHFTSLPLAVEEYLEIIENSEKVERENTAIDPPPTAETTKTPLPQTTEVSQEEKLGSVRNPYEVGQPIVIQLEGLPEFQVTITDYARGDRALRFVNSGVFPYSPPEGYEFVVFSVLVEHLGKSDEILEINKRVWSSVAAGRIFSASEATGISNIEPAFDFELFPGGKAEGSVLLVASPQDHDALVVIGMTEDNKGGTYFTIEQEKPLPPGILFMDDFSSRFSGWSDLYRDSTGITDYDQGGFRIQVQEPNYDYWANPNLRFTDVVVEVDAKKIGGPDDNDFGVICRYRDVENFYFLLVTTDGFHGIGKYSSGSAQLIGTDNFGTNDAVLTGDASNRIRGECVGDTLRLYVNGTLLQEVTDREHRSGDVGLIAGTFDQPGTDILFDNFIVYEPE